MINKKLFLLVAISVVLLFKTAISQIYINEVCSRNSKLVQDEDGDFPDWIELYNEGTSPVNLQGWHLTDDVNDMSKWTFPNVLIKEQSYLTLFASGKDRTQIIDHWETVVYASDSWKYIVPSVAPPANWRDPGFNDGAWASGPGGFGYGDGDDATVVPFGTISVMIRKSFNITDTSKLTGAILSIDYDDSFVAYLNGVEIARYNVGVQGFPPVWNEPAYDQREAVMFQSKYPEEYRFDEEELKSVLVNGTNVLAIECHNLSNTSSDMSLIPFLHLAIKDNSNDYGAVPFWFKGGASWLHTNFQLSGSGETVWLTQPSNWIIDQIVVPYTQVDHSSGRFPDGAAVWKLFGEPTPDSTNNGSLVYDNYVSDPLFSLDAGFYNGQQQLSLSNPNPNSNNRYTTDGSVPTDNSPLYTVPINIDSTRVIRARSFAITGLPSEVVTNTYIIDEPSDLPVISISTNPENLWDWNEGIYVLGPNAQPTVPYFGANFWQDWEKPIYMEFFDTGDTVAFEQGFGIKIHGGWSRSKEQKSFRILARGQHGKPTLDYQLFPDKPIYSFKRFILRSSGNENVWNGVHYRDALMHKAVQEDTYNDLQDYMPAALYLNGEYWGIYNIREKIGKYYINGNYGVHPDSLDLLEFEGSVKEGSNGDFLNMANFIRGNPMDDTANYNVAKNWLDIPNFCDHFITQTYYVNWDWPQNNIRYWRAWAPGSKWRYVLVDLDFGLGMGNNFTFNDLNRAINATNWIAQPILHSEMLKSLLVNIEFQNYFINRYADLINTTFHPNNLGTMALAIRDSIANEMQKHLARWGGDYNFWNGSEIPTMMTFINNRQGPARDHIEQEFNLNKQVSVTLNVNPSNAGKIKINTIVPDSTSWAGIYFDGVPVTMTPVPNPGFQFAYWQSSILVQSPYFNDSLTLNVDTNDVFTAYFFGSPDTPKVTISEVNYKSTYAKDAGDWVELHNYGTVDIDISSWEFKDENFFNIFTIPLNTILAPDEYLVLCQDTARFHSVYPWVSNVIGPFNFGLKQEGEEIRLFDQDANLYMNMTYGNLYPWPVYANGLGGTMELLDPSNDLSNATNWFDGCIGGSPGGAFDPDCPLAVEEIDNEPGTFQLTNYPNPFNQNTTIAFRLDQTEHVTIRISDVYGRSLAVLANKELNAGNHELQFNSDGLSSGIYYCQLSTENSTETRVLQLIK